MAEVDTLAPTYTLTTSASPVGGGTTSGAGSFPSGSSVTVVATPNPNYIFTRWVQDGAEVSISASYTFNIVGNTAFVAYFLPPPPPRGNCGLCFFSNRNAGGTLYCCYNPPTWQRLTGPTPGTTGLLNNWPQVDPNDWCGHGYNLTNGQWHTPDGTHTVS